MASIRNTPEFRNKISQLHTKLMGNPSKAELESMQLHIDALGKLAQISDGHHEDEEDKHHDAIVADVAQGIAEKNQIP